MIVRNAHLDRWRPVIARWLARCSIDLLRISLGLVFLVFGALKFVPGLSPVEDLVTDTMGALTVGFISGRVSLLLVATLETVVGLLLLTGRSLRLSLVLFSLAMVGILSPLVLFPNRLFAGPGNAPTLEGQYVLKDLVLLAAVLVVAASASGGQVVGERDRTAPDDHRAQSPKTLDAGRQQPFKRAA